MATRQTTLFAGISAFQTQYVDRGNAPFPGGLDWLNYLQELISSDFSVAVCAAVFVVVSFFPGGGLE
jgi:hypothetical protein